MMKTGNNQSSGNGSVIGDLHKRCFGRTLGTNSNGSEPKENAR